ncbi:MAG: single-stranded-DNA-specific exonuclease RecJ [Bacteroidia bacterium]
MKSWKQSPKPSNEAIEGLVKSLTTPAGPFPEPLAIILAQRNITTLAEAQTFLSPSLTGLHDPFLMKGMDVACERIIRAMEAGERIMIYGDYDVDGTTSVALLQSCLKDLGFEFPCYIPNRFTEGYGLSFEGIEYAQSQGCTLLIALDCGTKSVDKVRFAKAKGVEMIIVDHHTPGAELPEAVSMLNPLQPGCTYPDNTLSACALTMKLCQGLVARLRETSGPVQVPEGYDPFQEYSDLAALSIACDIVPLVGENRVMLHFGLEKIRKQPLPGIDALKQLDEYPREWSVSDLVFYMGPRINSAGRLDTATEAVALLTGKGDVKAIAESLDAFNEERKALDKAVTQQALVMIAEQEMGVPRATTVLFEPDWNKGIIGIVASRLIERHHRPTVLLTKSGEYLVGSGRSVPGFDLHAALEQCASHLVQFGGHKYAAGLTMKPLEFEGFRAAFEAIVADTLPESSKSPELRIDAELRLNQISDRFMRVLKRLGPFGPSNAEPNFIASRLTVKEASILKQEHVRFLLEQDGTVMEAIAFFQAEHWAEVNQLELDVVFQPDTKHYKGKTYLQLRVKDFRASPSK